MEWESKIHAIDRDTGELLDVKDVERGKYVIDRKQVTYQRKSKTHGIRHIKWLCSKNRQIEIWEESTLQSD